MRILIRGVLEDVRFIARRMDEVARSHIKGQTCQLE
jgi:hypothetical protein